MKGQLQAQTVGQLPEHSQKGSEGDRLDGPSTAAAIARPLANAIAGRWLCGNQADAESGLPLAGAAGGASGVHGRLRLAAARSAHVRAICAAPSRSSNSAAVRRPASR